jgi:hypothetical protein
MVQKTLKHLALITAVVLAGCTTIQSNPLTSQLAVQYATAKVIESAPDQEVRRQRVIELADRALLLASDQGVLISALQAELTAAAKLDELTYSDRLLAEYLINLVSAEISARAPSGWLSGASLISAREVLLWVQLSARSWSPSLYL